jgi:glycosyltransferase involved in cell wall biosynthesis
MKALLIHQAFVSPKEAGGTRHFEFAQYLRGQGHALTIVASSLSYLTGATASGHSGLVTKERVEGIDVLRAYTLSCLHKSFFWRVVSFLSFMCSSVIASFRAGSVDLVIGTSPPIFQAFSAWLVSFLRRRPLLLEIRDLWPEFAIDMGVLRSKPLIALARMFEKFLYARAAHIIVNSPAYRDYLIGKGVPEKKISLIPNGVDPEMFKPESDGRVFREELDLNGAFVVTYAGALGMANDIPTILNAAAELREQKSIQFLLVGDGKERPKLQKMADDMKLTNVKFTGARPKSEIADVLAASDACLATLLDIPMFSTTYPNKVFDYMAAGRPTVLGIDGVIRKVVEAANGGIFVPPGDSARLSEAIVTLFRNQELAREMGRSARKHVVEHFNRQKQSREFLQLCLRLTRGSDSAGPQQSGEQR